MPGFLPPRETDDELRRRVAAPQPGPAPAPLPPAPRQPTLAELYAQQQQKAYDARMADQNAMRRDYALPGYEDRRGQLGNYIKNAGDQGEFRGQQSDLAGYLGRVMRGEDSLAAQHLQRGADQAIAYNQALRASARPGTQAAAARGASQDIGRTLMDLTGQTADMAVRERLGAANALGGVLQGARGQDIGYLSDMLRAEQQNAALQQQGMMGYQGNELQRYLKAQDEPDFGDRLFGLLGSALPVVGQVIGGKK